MTMPFEDDLLRREVKRLLVPALLDLGFAADPAAVVANKSRELKAAFPFGWFNRDGTNGQERIEIQFEKRGQDRFVLNFGVIPPEGVQRPWGFFPPEKVDSVAGLDESYRLMGNPKSGSWFRPSFITFDRARSITKCVEDAVAALTEIEAWYASRVVGPHVARIGFPLPPLLGQ